MSFEPGEQLIPKVEGLDRRARFKMVTQLLESYPVAKNAARAHRLVAMAFEEVEQNPDIVKLDSAMGVGSFLPEHAIPYAGRNIYYQMYSRHILLVGDNGAICMLRDDGHINRLLLKTDIERVKEMLPTDFSKPGEDGKDIWGN